MTPKTLLSALSVVVLAASSSLSNAQSPATSAPAPRAADAAAARLQPGSNVLPYEIHNVASGDEYCQMCKFAERAGTVAAYGNLRDEKFWADLEKMQTLQDQHKNFGFFGQVLDSTDAVAIAAEAKKHNLKIPVVYAVDNDWSDIYKVGGVSRTVYYSSQFKVLWIGQGLEEGSLAKLNEQIKASPQG